MQACSDNNTLQMEQFLKIFEEGLLDPARTTAFGQYFSKYGFVVNLVRVSGHAYAPDEND